MVPTRLLVDRPRSSDGIRCSPNSGDGPLGAGTGPLAAAHPTIRVLFGAVMVVACVATPAAPSPGPLLTVAVAAATLVMAGPCGRVISRGLLFGLAIYLPLLAILLAPVAVGAFQESPGTAPAPAALEAALLTAVTIAIKGMAVLVVTLSVVSTLRPSQLHQALGALPLPRTMRLLLIQIVHQTGILFHETTRIRQVLAVRSAGDGARSRWRVLCGLPRAWLERVALRATRTARAMEVRGYVHMPAPPFPGPRQWRRVDLAAALGSAASLAAAIILHVA